MLNEHEMKPHVEGRPMHRVSSALWPLNVRKVVATGKAAQRRRDWIMQGRWLVILADALTMRVLLIFTTLLVVISSLFVAVLGLHFWYLLLLPLLLFVLLLALPSFLASRRPTETLPPSLAGFAQEFKSSAGQFTSYAHELKSSAGFLHEAKSGLGFTQDLQSSPGFRPEPKSYPGFTQDVQSSSGLLSSGDSDAPAAAPLVRVLETYDLRGAQVTHFLKLPAGETDKHALIQRAESDY